MKKRTKFGLVVGTSALVTGIAIYQVRQRAKRQRARALEKMNRYFDDQGVIITSWIYEEVALDEATPIFKGGIIVEVDHEPQTFEFTINANTLEIIGIEAVKDD
ncbi:MULTISPECIES: hypothetical protein [unclassified Enterococcus]|uniref:hypothetical protein n=1 Tax=unclassified Enterococcus TaxID=2608891 RepID=UPI001551D1BD|nr:MULTISPECIES: hypothetical protein [unclassified Enterococcus]MBS7577560.1 hypothetical protein [Enterococcus sp. MMGLQ5-2]MBS7584941.1 hypothetical protein [Enterococcus sp. MMGLQ5-1]NPD12796.1 hypothetical protein [Enterococcus sp. MMGLQ5-1]NPD37393.1 hypothetical protein [Enterococcus sp. MMGLQ5-2]